MLCFSVASAQSDLFVSNGSYLFVDGTGFASGTDVAPLFVTDDVNIENNGHIYLRNDAQLLQGNDIGNQGMGELSIYQNSNVNQFAYNYWCSPVGNTTSSSSNNPFNINQIDDPLFITSSLIDSGNPTFLNVLNGTPNMTSMSPDLIISTKWLYTFVVANAYSDWNPLSETSAVSPGLGFTMKGMGPNGATVNQIYDFRGKPNNGTITNEIAAGQFTLIGNPYPSALDLADFLWDTDNVTIIDDQDSPVVSGTTGAVYFWVQDPANSDSHLIANYVGGYASYTCTQPDGSDNIMESYVPATFIFYLPDGTPLTPPSPQQDISRTARRYLQVGQGFMIEGDPSIPASPPASPTLVHLKNSHRQFIKEGNGSSSDFFRNSSSGSVNSSSLVSNSQYDENGNFIVPEDYKRFRVLLSFNELYTRELLANFHATATPGFDYGLEAKTPNEIPSDAYWTQNNENYVIQAYAFDLNLRMPLVIDIEEQQPLTIGIYDVQNFDEDQGIYIYDSEINQYINLKEQNYQINIEPGHYDNRFEIVFTPGNILEIEEFDISKLTIRQNNSNQQLTVLNPNGIDVKNIEVFDVAGKRMVYSHPEAILSRYNLATANLSEGVYIVNVTTNGNTVVSEKIIIKN